ncbi:FAD-binding oxidoreductase [Gottfriedia endophytica]|uniref:FAD-binding oxidoreductase n=1 Tax=Gottfriedia endophytica TaxID=2820819 RepID=UPI001FD78B57|nr:FAD-binding oxidoreductase [Gottfriedia endophytica]
MKIKKIILMLLSFLLVVFCLSYGSFRYALSHYRDDLYQNGVINDVGRLLPTKVERVVKGKEEEQLVKIVNETRENGGKISIAGERHSQGGHTFYKDATVLDMTTYRKILNVDPNRKTIHVQSGATWDDVQKALYPYGLSVKVMQSLKIFSVGGSLSVNAHGRDCSNGSIGNTINWFRLLKADGTIEKVSRTSNPTLFSHVIGGYGLLGVILDVELQATNDVWYKTKTKKININDFSNYVHNMKKQKAIEMGYARISVAPSSLLNQLYVIEYYKFDSKKKLDPLKEDVGAFTTASVLELARHSDWGKDLFWDLQKKFLTLQDGKLITRNNNMRSESDFLLYKNQNDTDILQEYFIPIDEFSSYVSDLKSVLKKEKINLLNLTIRYVPKDQVSTLGYAKKEDMIALVALINHGKSEDSIKSTSKSLQHVMDVALNHHGTFYLPYYPYATDSEVVKSYPNFQEFIKTKKEYDPKELFYSTFYERYKNAK